MAPIVVEFNHIHELQPLSLALIAIGSLASVFGIVLTVFVCTCGKKEKEQEQPTGDVAVELPKDEVPETPAEIPQELLTEKSTKTAVTAKSQVTQSVMGAVQQAGDLQLMSQKGEAPSIAAGKGQPTTNIPSLKLMDPKSTVQTGGSPFVAKTVGGKSVSVAAGQSTSVAQGGKTTGGQSVTVTSGKTAAVGGKSVSVVKSVGTKSVSATA